MSALVTPEITPIRLHSSSIYGTAWKKERTSELVTAAITVGFKSIDTAAQPRHYREAEAGVGIRQAIRAGPITRAELHIQTKFTWTSGQNLDSTLPYDQSTSISQQVRQSVEGSLHNLRHEDSPDSAYLDCVLLHFPLPTLSKTLQAWQALEEYVPQKIRMLGICNVSVQVLQVLLLAKSIRVRPSIVQNRFHKETQYDREVRTLCSAKGILYQAFGILKSNPSLLASDLMMELATILSQPRETVLYSLVLQLGDVCILNGTTQSARMATALSCQKSLTEWASKPENKLHWQQHWSTFIALLDPTS